MAKATKKTEAKTVTVEQIGSPIRRPDVQQRTLIGHWTFSAVGMARCVRFVAEHDVDIDLQFSDRWALDDAEIAYRKFDAQTAGKAVFEF